MQMHNRGIFVGAVLIAASGAWVAVHAAPSQKAAALKLTQASNGKSYTIRQGQQFTVALPTNPTTGYTLSMLVDGTEPWSMVSRRYAQDPGDPGAVGRGGTETFRFRAAKKGKAQLVFLSVRKFDLKSTLGQAEPWTVEVEVK